MRSSRARCRPTTWRAESARTPMRWSRLMRALVSRGVFRRHRNGTYGLNRLADTLRSRRADIDGRRSAVLWVAAASRALEHAGRGGQVRQIDHSGAARQGLFRVPGRRRPFGQALQRCDDQHFRRCPSMPLSPPSTSTPARSSWTSVVATDACWPRFWRAAPSSRGVLYELPDVAADAPSLLTKFGLSRTGSHRDRVVLRRRAGRRKRLCAQAHHSRLAR